MKIAIELPIVVYTHTDMKDIWPMFFGQFKKYINGYKVYVAVNQIDTQIPSDYIQLVYDDLNSYTERWRQILSQIEEETIMFLHEDMILFDKPNFELLEKYYGYVKSGVAESIKMNLTGDSFVPSDIDSTLVTNQYSQFSIQPTIVKKEIFKNLVNTIGSLNIWQFEEAIVSYGKDFMIQIGGEKKRGIYHYDSIIFPYIATAINKGKWNMSEYQKELDKMFNEYGVMPFERGIV